MSAVGVGDQAGGGGVYRTWLWQVGRAQDDASLHGGLGVGLAVRSTQAVPIVQTVDDIANIVFYFSFTNIRWYSQHYLRQCRYNIDAVGLVATGLQHDTNRVQHVAFYNVLK